MSTKPARAGRPWAVNLPWKRVQTPFGKERWDLVIDGDLLVVYEAVGGGWWCVSAGLAITSDTKLEAGDADAAKQAAVCLLFQRSIRILQALLSC